MQIHNTNTQIYKYKYKNTVWVKFADTPNMCYILVGNHQLQEDMLGDNLPLVAEEDTQDNPVVVQALGIPDQAAWDRAGLLAAWALHRQEVVH